MGMHNWYSEDTTAYTLNSTISFIDSTKHFINKYPNELVNMSDHFDSWNSINVS